MNHWTDSNQRWRRASRERAREREREMETKPTEISSSKMFGGYNKRYKHFSPTLGCSMTFHVYFPPSLNQKFPVCLLNPFHFLVLLGWILFTQLLFTPIASFVLLGFTYNARFSFLGFYLCLWVFCFFSDSSFIRLNQFLFQLYDQFGLMGLPFYSEFWMYVGLNLQSSLELSYQIASAFAVLSLSLVRTGLTLWTRDSSFGLQNARWYDVALPSALLLISNIIFLELFTVLIEFAAWFLMDTLLWLGQHFTLFF